MPCTIQYLLSRQQIGYCFGATGQNAIDKFHFQQSIYIIRTGIGSESMHFQKKYTIPQTSQRIGIGPESRHVQKNVHWTSNLRIQPRALIRRPFQPIVYSPYSTPRVDPSSNSMARQPYAQSSKLATCEWAEKCR